MVNHASQLAIHGGNKCNKTKSLWVGKRLNSSRIPQPHILPSGNWVHQAYTSFHSGCFRSCSPGFLSRHKFCKARSWEDKHPMHGKNELLMEKWNKAQKSVISTMDAKFAAERTVSKSTTKEWRYWAYMIRRNRKHAKDPDMRMNAFQPSKLQCPVPTKPCSHGSLKNNISRYE